MEKTTDGKGIVILNSISELKDFLKENEGKIVSVQIELVKEPSPPETGGDGNG